MLLNSFVTADWRKKCSQNGMTVRIALGSGEFVCHVSNGMVKLSSVVSVYTYSHTLKLGSSPALSRGFSSVLECKAAIEGLAVDSRCSTYCSRGHNEA